MRDLNLIYVSRKNKSIKVSPNLILLVQSINYSISYWINAANKPPEELPKRVRIYKLQSDKYANAARLARVSR